MKHYDKRESLEHKRLLKKKKREAYKAKIARVAEAEAAGSGELGREICPTCQSYTISQRHRDMCFDSIPKIQTNKAYFDDLVDRGEHPREEADEMMQIRSKEEMYAYFARRDITGSPI
jgi:hypothetical protein